MSAETLRRAASLMREDAARGLAWDGDYAADKGWLAPPVALAVADWLDQSAFWMEGGSEPDDLALAVARAFLGESS